MAEPQAAEADDSTRLYRYVPSGQLWELKSSAAHPAFIDNSSDGPDAGCSHWYLQAGSDGQLHIEVSHSFEADSAKTRFKLVDSDGARVWGLVFSSSEAFEAFSGKWNRALYENTYNCAFQTDAASKVSAHAHFCQNQQMQNLAARRV